MKWMIVLLTLTANLKVIAEDFNHALKGLSDFTVLIPYKSSATNIFVNELEKEGHAKRFSLSDPKGVNFEGMGTGLRLMLLITPFSLLNEAHPEAMHISLSLSTTVEILKTKNQVDSCIWTTNAFSLKSKTEETIKTLADQFISSYKETNPQISPTFYIYD